MYKHEYPNQVLIIKYKWTIRSPEKDLKKIACKRNENRRTGKLIAGNKRIIQQTTEY